MSNTLLESLWSRVDANIGARIAQISGLLTQALSANTESIAARDDAAAAAGLAEEQAGIATAAADRADPDGFRDGIDQRVSAVEGLVDSKADTSLVNARPAFFSGVGEPVDVPNAVAGDYYFDTDSGELHKITGV